MSQCEYRQNAFGKYVCKKRDSKTCEHMSQEGLIHYGKMYKTCNMDDETAERFDAITNNHLARILEHDADTMDNANLGGEE